MKTRMNYFYSCLAFIFFIKIIVGQNTDDVIKDLKTRILPLPQSITKMSDTSRKIYLDYTTLQLKLVQQIKNAQVKSYIEEMFKKIKEQMFTKFDLQMADPKPNREYVPIYLQIWLENADKEIFEIQGIDTKENYELIIQSRDFIFLSASNYYGIIRGLQTLALISLQEEYNIYLFDGYYITDAPNYQYRGLMLDTSRHFLEVSQIKKTIDAMMMNKLNILHWHIVDSETFPLYIKEVPELTQSGTLGKNQIYYEEDVADIIIYAEKRAIRVIPEIDTPAHTDSWGQSDKYKEVLSCPDCDWDVCGNGPPQGTLNPTLTLTWELVTKVLKQVVGQFKDEFIHLGGDEVFKKCWEINSQIISWMKDKGIKTLPELENYYKVTQRKILTDMNPNKKAIYWFTNDNEQIKDGDIIQFWGKDAEMDTLAQYTKNQYILSPYDKTYLDCGKGNKLGKDSWCIFNPIRNLFEMNPKKGALAKPEIQKLVLGGEACLWSNQVSSKTIQNEVWSRTSALAERLWNNDFYETNYEGKTETEKFIIIRGIVQRITALGNYMTKNGIAATPVTTEYCAKNPSECFFP